jgi:signal transduction histidine kinase
MDPLERTSSPAGAEPLGDFAPAEQVGWLVRMRWMAVAGVVAATAIAWMLGLVARPAPLLGVAAAMAAANAFWHVRARRRLQAAAAARPGDGGALVAGQILLDLFALTVLLGLSGGADNPFAVFFAFHMAIGAMLLPPAVALRIGFAGCFLWTAIVLVQRGGLLPVVPLTEVAPRSSLALLAGRVIGMVLMMLGIVYFVGSIAERLREAERARRAHERVARSRERFARIGELSAGVAHSVRNPLHGLINSVDVLAARPDNDEDSREILSLMTEALHRIETVTQRLLALARDAPIHRTPTDLDALVVDMLRLVSPRVRGSASRLDAEPGGVGLVDLDPVHFGEALANVINNAIDACAAGGDVIVRTSRGPGQDADAIVVVEVVDTGTGIAKEHLASIFAPFFTTKAVGEGTGLGLAITRRIIEEHEGRVTVDSAPGAGTRVRFVVPRHARESTGGVEA